MSDAGLRGGLRVLVVDDDATLRDVFADTLRSAGYHVDVAADGAKALAQLITEPFDMLITDILMPYLDGWQLIATAVEKQPMLRIVAMTGGGRVEDERRAQVLGVPLLRKPFPFGALQAALQRIV